MGFLDKYKGRGDELKAKAAELARQHGDKIDQGLDKAGDAVSRATKGKYDDKIDSATRKAKEGVDKIADDGHQGPGTPGTTPPPRP
ncbi:antitoxin [Solicola sp. PLA-1-18]|uniref:antitoxin n=1 Tax=Solicola sp. PLA-1-18 TaxID=3380532 RepID=UPI003B7D74AF